MRRRELIAGLGSLGILGGAGVVALRGVPSMGESSSGDTPPEPITVETLEAPGSRAGEVQVPAPDRPTFIDFFGTWCPPCVEQMPALEKAHDRVGDSLLFISVTTEAVGRSVAEETVVDWWRENEGDWLLGIDPTAELAARYLAGGFPSAVAIDASGRVQWSDAGVHTADELVAGIEHALE